MKLKITQAWSETLQITEAMIIFFVLVCLFAEVCWPGIVSLTIRIPVLLSISAAMIGLSAIVRKV